MIDITSFNKALKSVWIKKYLDVNNKGKWKLFIDAELENLGGATVLSNLDKVDTKKIAKSLSPFLKEILEIWAELNYQDQITSVDSFLAQSLWHNSLIRIMGKPIYYKNWHQSGIDYVNQIIKEKPNVFLSLNEFEQMYHIKVCPLTFCGIVSAVKTLWRKQNQALTQNAEKKESLATVMLKSNKPNRLAYKILIEAKTKSPIPSQLKWYNAIQDSYDFDWQKTYQIALKCTKSTKLIEFNFRFLHHTLATNIALVKMGFKNDVKCTFCNEEPEKILHLFWCCNKIQLFWKHVFAFLQQCNILSQNCVPSESAVLGMRPETSKNGNKIDLIFLVARFYIWLCRSKEKIPVVESFISYLKFYKKELEPFHIS